MSLKPFQDRDAIAVGQPVPFSLYGADRKILLAKGLPVVSERMCDSLLDHAVYRAPDDDDSGAPELPLAPDPQSPLAPPKHSALDALPRGLRELAKRYSNYEERSRFGLRIARDERGESYPSFVIGVVDDKRYLILAAPKDKDGKLVPIARDEAWLCRLFNATTVFRFTGKVLKVASEPFPYLHVELPRTVEQRMVRRMPRALASLPVSLHRSNGERGVIVDLSVSGARLAVTADVHFEKNAKVQIFMSIGMLERQYDLHLSAVVCAVFGAADPESPNVHFYGLEFVTPPDSSMLILHAFVQQQLTEELDRLSRVLVIEAAVDSPSRK